MGDADDDARRRGEDVPGDEGGYEDALSHGGAVRLFTLYGRMVRTILYAPYWDVLYCRSGTVGRARSQLMATLCPPRSSIRIPNPLSS